MNGMQCNAECSCQLTVDRDAQLNTIAQSADPDPRSVDYQIQIMCKYVTLRYFVFRIIFPSFSCDPCSFVRIMNNLMKNN